MNHPSEADRDASDLLTPAADDSEVLDGDSGGGGGGRRRRRRTAKMDCSGDRDSVSSLPSTLAAYIHEEHRHSGGTDRCLTQTCTDRES